LPLCADAPEDQHSPASNVAANAPNAFRLAFIIFFSLAGAALTIYFFRASAYG
jgi:hypothetical protein